MTQVLLNKYDARALAFKVTYQNESIRASEEYEAATDDLLDMTMSCNRREAIKWMVHEMEEAIKYGIESRDKGWQHKFLAAYDICERL